jgi:hypothetical protein
MGGEKKKPASALAEARAYGATKGLKLAHPQDRRSVQQHAQQVAGVEQNFIGFTVRRILWVVKWAPTMTTRGDVATEG